MRISSLEQKLELRQSVKLLSGFKPQNAFTDLGPEVLELPVLSSMNLFGVELEALLPTPEKVPVRAST